MKRLALYFGLASVLVASCSIQEEDFKTQQQDDVIYYATFEQPAEEGTRVYANEDLLLRWTADDRVSIFGKITYNQQYKFLGETGDNSGGFSKVDGAEYVTGNPIPHTVSVYPYQEGTKISEKEVLSLTLPAKQHYAEKTFGLGANTMVSVSDDNVLQYKNVGGYLMLKLYGEGVSVSSITLKGNNGEKLAGKATVTMPLDGAPAVVMADDATSEITLVCDTPVALGATAEESKQFWFVIPPVTFSKGFTITLRDSSGRFFEKSTSKSVSIERNNLSKMSPMEVVPVALKYLTFASEGTTTISLSNFHGNAPVLFYSIDKTNWTLWDYSELSFSSDHSLYLYGDNPDGFNSQDRWSRFVTNGSDFGVSGDIMSLIDYKQDLTIIPSTFCFRSLFRDCVGLNSAPELPATTLAGNCYSLMFSGCTSLTVAPELPATTLAGYCYSSMFSGCTSLTVAPELPATTLANGCYSSMFSGCTNLTVAPELPATTLAEDCYYSIFSDCTSLTTAPELPATTLANGCYSSMFSGCTSLTTAPDLPATTLAYNCYFGMFSGCTSLTVAPEFPATTLAEYCCEEMFALCTSLTSAPELPATTLAENCYTDMFFGCTSLTTAPDLPATTLAYNCYFGMFSGCTSLTVAPELPATTLAKSCYSDMFSGCTSLTTAPDLPASTLVEDCYRNMFYGCSNLNYVKCLATNSWSDHWVENWLVGVASSGTFYKPLGIAWTRGESGIPWGWTIIDCLPVPDAIDLGLPSGLKWASFNLGATIPHEYGDYYAWGDVEPYYSSQNPLIWKEGKGAGYAWASYKWCMGSNTTMTKYCTESNYGYNGFTDGKTVLDPEDDAAHVILGGNWRMPTDEEWTELRENCTWSRITLNGVDGKRATGLNGNWIFLPAAGYWEMTGNAGLNTNSYTALGYYWSSSLTTDIPFYAWSVTFNGRGDWDVSRDAYSGVRNLGFSVRPVTK